MASLGLPAINSELKSLSSFIQRAEELYEREPVIAYWCLYYSAQLGISTKAASTSSRLYLAHLLDVLEKLKESIGSNDAITVESASAAFVENFAVKVFNRADNEDREGKATARTAQTFRAAANFLEILKTFPQTDVTINVDEKVKYAKWKAADIAKSIREGRKPVAGPAKAEASEEDDTITISDLPSTLVTSPPPEIDTESVSRKGDGDEGSWSTTATPGVTGFDHSHPPTPIAPPPKRASRLQNTFTAQDLEDVDTNTVDLSLPSAPSGPASTSTQAASAPTLPPPVAPLPSIPASPPLELGSASATSPSFQSIYTSTSPLPPPANIAPLPAASAAPEIGRKAISQTQKHCRFAISALDFEDVETARKELRAALALLGP